MQTWNLQGNDSGNGPSQPLKLRLREIGGRLKNYLEQRGLNLETLQRHSGLSRKQINKIIDGKQYPVKNLMLLLGTLQNLNGRWLIYGEGDMLKQNVNDPAHEAVNRLGQANKTWNVEESVPGPEIDRLLKKVLAGQKKLIKQNRKILALIKAIVRKRK